VKLETELAYPGEVRGTPSGVHDVLLNLVFNAVDALPEGGTIRIATAPGDLGARLTVTDDGIGMTEAVRLRVFEPFFTTKANVGTGLGLSTVYGTVTRWGGRIDVASEPGRGTTFTVDLPAWQGEGVRGAVRETASEGRAGRVLVVEDEEIVREVVSRILGRGHTVDVVRNGQEALAKAARDRYDVALVDLGMPGMPGDQVAKALRESDPAIATVVMTGWSLRDDDPRMAPFDFRVQKPITDIAHLQEVVEQAIVKHDERSGAR
jgi:CheY-like chemotaxis protein